ncbi:hypothetical protein KCP73_15695 [Salmonella enterica subsp. enterica]|nr:hypothetical protein KCP73_15695 [Salmonella enterica subsp. enterica]
MLGTTQSLCRPTLIWRPAAVRYALRGYRCSGRCICTRLTEKPVRWCVSA